MAVQQLTRPRAGAKTAEVTHAPPATVAPPAGVKRPPARPSVGDRRLMALGDILAHGATQAGRPDADVLQAAATMTAAAADLYAISYGYSGALAVPAGLRVLARAARVLARAAGDEGGDE